MCWLFLALACVMLVDADIPVHCLHKHVVGDWTFHRTKANSQAKDMYTCNRAGSYLGGGDFGLGEPNYKVDDKIKVSLRAPNTASAVIDGKKVEGSWTMMYDEGFEVNLGGAKYFAFSKYSGSKHNHMSHCGKTFPGWYHGNPEKTTWGCYHGIKDTEVAPQRFRRFGEGKSKGFKRNEDGDIVAPSQSRHSHDARHAMPTDDEGNNRDDDVVDEMNDDQEELLQFAAMSKKDRLHSNYYEGQHELVEAVNKGHREGKHTWHAAHYPSRSVKRMGVLHEPGKGLGEGDNVELMSYRDQVAQKVDVSDIPEHFDWRNVNGKNFVPGVRDQKCGSCYAFATRDMMEARMAILQKKPIKEETKMSVQSVLSCNAYSQGCAGGFPYTTAKFYQDVGATSDKDQPSNADWHGVGETSSPGKPDKIKCDTAAKPVAKAWKYQYVGGFYGASNEKSMMRDLYDHGPLAVCFQVGLGFGNYKGGVFKQDASLPRTDHYGRVNHAVLITGFGKTADGQKYWHVKNSWGKQWGQDGYFKIERGTNQLNMEGDAVAVYPSKGASLNSPVRMQLGESIGADMLEAAESELAAWREEDGSRARE